MARGARSRDYEDENDMYSGERDSYRPRPRRSRDRHYVKDRGYVRRHSIPPPIERMERLRVRDHSRPETTQDELDDGLIGPSDVDDIEIPPEELLSDTESPRDSGRRHHGQRPPRVVVPDEDLVSPQDLDGRLTDSGSERDAHPRRRDVYTGRRRRVREPKHEADEIYSGGDEMTPEAHRRARSGIRYPPIPRRRPKSGYHTDLEDEDDHGMIFPPSQRTIVDERADLWPGTHRTFEDIDSPDSVSRRPRRPVESGRDRFEPRTHGELSSPESEDSAEYSGAPIPPMPPMPPGRSSQHLRVPEEDRKREILIEPRDETDIPPPLRNPSPDMHGRRMKEKISIPRSRVESLDRGSGTVTREPWRSDHSVAEQISDGITTNELADHWAIVNAAPKSQSSARDSSTSQEVPPARHRERKTKFTASDERHSGDDTDYGRARVARRYVGVKEKKERLWTEITKDLVVKEAIERMGFEYEETVTSYFIFSYLQYDDVSALVELSEDIRAARRRRIQELDRRRGSVRSSIPLRDEPLLSMEPSRRRHRDGRRPKDREIREDGRGRPEFERR
ncbi:hypothetical protein BJX96DRAFT_183759 [Aspergillus floccosus]